MVETVFCFPNAVVFFLSGYSTAYFFPSRNPKHFIKNKVYRLLIPYLGWTTIHYLIAVILSNDYRSLGSISFLKELLILDFWFSKMPFVFFVIVWMCDVILHQLHKTRNAMISSTLLLVATTCILCLAKIPLITHSVGMWYYLWFVAGCIVFRLLERSKLKHIGANPFFRNGAAIVSAILMETIIYILSKKSISYKIVAGVFTFGICSVVCALEKSSPIRIKSIFA